MNTPRVPERATRPFASRMLSACLFLPRILSGRMTCATMRRLAAVAAILLWPASAALAAEDEEAAAPGWTRNLRLRGRVAEEFAYRLHDPGDVSKLRTTGWLEGKYAFSEAVSLRAATRGWYDAVFDATHRYPAHVEKDQQAELSLREALLSASAGALDARIGLQQVVWGEAIGTFVTDVVNPRDFREFVLPDFSELRIPLLAVGASYRLAPGVTLEGLWTPDTRSDTLPKRGAEFQFAPAPYRFRNPVVRLPDDHDEWSLEQSHGGARLSVLIEGWDASLIYYDAADRSPVFFQRRVAQAPPRPEIVVLEPRHPRVHIVGATLGKSFEPVVLRGEAALTVGKRYETIDPLDPDGVVRRDTVDLLLGVDYTVASQVDVALQLSQKILLGPATNIVRPGVEARVTTSVTLRLTTGFFDNTLNPSVLFIVNANRGDFRLGPRIDWLATGSLTISVGADIFGGPRQTLYGQFDDNDRVYVTTTWRF